MDEERFNLRQLAREFLANAPTPDPRDAAEKLLSTLSDTECRHALAVTLPDYMRGIAGTVERHTRRAAQGITGADRIRDWWQKQLGQPIFTGQEWKFLRECTAVDLRGAAAERYKIASQTKAEGDRWAELADLLAQRGYGTVGDLPEDELKAWASK